MKEKTDKLYIMKNDLKKLVCGPITQFINMI